MRLIRYGMPGAERPGLIDDHGRIRTLIGLVEDISADSVAAGALDLIAQTDPTELELVGSIDRFGPPIAGVGKIVCAGLNYRDHAAEANMEVPDEPVLFMKATTAICGPNDHIVLPSGHSKTDWEVELGVVIGRTARSVPESDVYDYIAGYCVAHDVSERAYQLERGGQWVKGKSFDTFCPLGPWLVTVDAVSDPQSVGIWLDVNGERRQNGSTREMIFSVPLLVSYVSRLMTLEPGDVILTGTPAGVALGQKDVSYLRPGDVVRLGIDGLGVQQQRVVEPGSAPGFETIEQA